jgi:sec-independent protein translocase protein TatA
MGAFNIWKWLIILAIIFVIFGTKKLKTMGSDLGAAIKGFKNEMEGGKKTDADDKMVDNAIDVKSERVD